MPATAFASCRRSTYQPGDCGTGPCRTSRGNADSAVRFRRKQSPQFSHIPKVFGDAEIVVETEYLSQVTDVGARVACRSTKHDRLAGCGGHHAAENLKDGGLAGAIRSDQSKNLAVGDCEIDAANRFHRAIVLLKPGDANRGSLPAEAAADSAAKCRHYWIFVAAAIDCPGQGFRRLRTYRAWQNRLRP